MGHNHTPSTKVADDHHLKTTTTSTTTKHLTRISTKDHINSQWLGCPFAWLKTGADKFDVIITVIIINDFTA